MKYRSEALRPNGMITGAEFEAAVAAGSKEQYESLLDEVKEARAEFAQLEKIVDEQFGPNALSFVEAKESFAECQEALASILRKKAPATSASLSPGATSTLDEGSGLVEGMVGDAWSQAERMARAGEIDAALSTMTALAAAEPNGRVRFQRKLLLADICMKSNRLKLARSILEELDELIEKHNLTAWETSDVVGAVWARLVRCYRDERGGTASPDKAAEFFRKLSRLDPWQALQLGESTEQSS
jgi:hypothetical protein